MAEFNTNCPHCNAELQVQEEWIGMEVECPQCKKTLQITAPQQENKEKVLNISPSTEQNASQGSTEKTTFLFICQNCGTEAYLPRALEGTKYECKSCCEECIAEEALEKKCPHCGNTVKINAKICKHCKKTISENSLKSKITDISNASKIKGQASLQAIINVKNEVKRKVNLKQGFFIAACTFFLAFLVVFSCGTFSKNVQFRLLRAKDMPSIGYGGKYVNTSSYSTISVGESSYGTYKNSITIADNLKYISEWQRWIMGDFRTFGEEYQKKEVLFNISYGLLGIAIFLLLTGAFLDKFFTISTETVKAEPETNLKS